MLHVEDEGRALVLFLVSATFNVGSTGYLCHLLTLQTAGLLEVHLDLEASVEPGYLDLLSEHHAERLLCDLH